MVLQAVDTVDVMAFIEKLKEPPFQLTFQLNGWGPAKSQVLLLLLLLRLLILRVPLLLHYYHYCCYYYYSRLPLKSL
jgi:hypothetical protein